MLRSLSGVCLRAVAHVGPVDCSSQMSFQNYDVIAESNFSMQHIAALRIQRRPFE